MNTGTIIRNTNFHGLYEEMICPVYVGKAKGKWLKANSKKPKAKSSPFDIRFHLLKITPWIPYIHYPLVDLRTRHTATHSNYQGTTHHLLLTATASCILPLTEQNTHYHSPLTTYPSLHTAPASCRSHSTYHSPITNYQLLPTATASCHCLLPHTQEAPLIPITTHPAAVSQTPQNKPIPC